jgi:hypothetical protein
MGQIVANYYREKPYQGYMGATPSKPVQRYMLTGNRVDEIHNAVVHTFTMGDVDDPILYAGEPLYQWQQSDAGKWVMEHAVESPMWHRQQDAMQWGHTFAITAKLKAKDYSFFLLKWGEKGTRK